MSNGSDNIQVELVKLVSGERLLRLSDLSAGLAFEKKLEPLSSVARQKQSLFSVFHAALSRQDRAAD